jgi:hypothetical protein
MNKDRKIMYKKQGNGDWGSGEKEKERKTNPKL